MDGQNRRREDASVAELLGMMRSLMNDFNGHAEKLLCVEGKLDKLLHAFPENGLEAHRQDHESRIIEQKSIRELKASVIKNVATAGTWGTILVIGYALWEYFKLRINT